MGMERVDYSGRPSAFSWLDGTSVGDTYSNFADRELNNEQGQEDCGVFYTSNGLWRSESCESRYYVCQRPAG